jgi:serine/threonine protein kinase
MSSGTEKVEPKNEQTIYERSDEKIDKLIGTTVVEKYKIIKVLGKGSFGVCYEGIDTTNENKVAIKIANNSKEALKILKQEISIYEKLENLEGIPKVYYNGKYNAKYLFVMQLLGPDLATLFHKCLKKFSPKTIFMLAEQMITRLKSIHANGLVHRDIKPENFLIGSNDNEKNKLFLIDFGLTKPYIDHKTKTHIQLTGGKTLTGTVRYCSLNAHNGHDLSRRDDLESVAHILIYLFRGSLPWDDWKSDVSDELYIEVKNKKSGILVEDLCADLPPVLGQFLKYCRQLDFDEEPIYSYWQKMFIREQYVMKFEWDLKYDWIKD